MTRVAEEMPVLPGAMPRLIATDLDGTLLGADGEVSARTARALASAQAEGIEIVFVTARPPRWIGMLAHLVGAHGTVICLNGALVYDTAQQTVLAEHVMPDDLVRTLTAELRAAVPAIAFAAERSRGFAGEHRFRSVHAVPSDAVMAEQIETALDGGTGKLLARNPGAADGDLLATVDSVLAGRAIVADSGAVGLAEITGPGVTKAATLARWAAERGIARHEVWAFGDMPNDLAMLEWAGRSFAVGNAHPMVLAAADEVCGSNEADGVAVVLEAALDGAGPSRTVSR